MEPLNPPTPTPSTPPQPAVQPEVSSPVESQGRHWPLWLFGGIALLALGAAIGVFSAKFFSQSTTQPQISTYQDCLAAKGSIIQESYPATCVTVSGQRFVQPLTDEEKQGLQPPDLYREPAGSAATADWKTYTFQPLQLSLKIPSELTVHTEEPNPGNDFTAYVQNYPFNSPIPSENAYQLHIVWQKIPTITQSEFQQLQNDLDNKTIENTAIDGYPATKGQVKGERNRFVTYILKGNTKISLFTSEPTKTNENLTNQILSTFHFLK